MFRIIYILAFCFVNLYAVDDLKSIGIELNISDVLQSYDNDGVTLKELLERANNNYSLQSQDLLVQQARKEKLISKLTFIPTLEASYNYNNIQTSVNVGYQTQNAQLALNFRLDAKDFYNIKQKGVDYSRILFDKEYAKQNIYLAVIQQYYTYFNNQSNLLTLKQKLEQFQSDVDRTQKLYDQGLRTIADLESLKAQAALTEYQIDNTRLALEQSKLMLEYLTNSDIDSIKRVQIDDPRYMLNDRYDIKSLQKQIESINYQNKQLHFFPILNIRDTYTYNIEVPFFVSQLAGAGGSPFFAANYATHQNNFGISVSYQLLDKITLSFQKQSITLSKLSNEKLLAYKKSEQKKDEELYRKALQLALNQIQSAKTSLISANLSFDNVKKRYDANISTFTEYLQALSTKYDAEYTLIQALNNYELQKANYIFYSGQELKDYIK